MHIKCEPPILYFGTPVVLISTVNEDGTFNLAPMSSAFWLMWRCVLGLGRDSKTTQNILRTGECVLNLPSSDQVAAVNRLAKTTGSNPVSGHKAAFGYRHEVDKFGIAGLTPLPSETVHAPRVAECPVQLETVLVASHAIADGEEMSGFAMTFEMRVQRVHLSESIMMDGVQDRVDPNKWRPLIMSFQQFYGLGPQLQKSILAEIPEALYRCPDVDRARNISGNRVETTQELFCE